MTTLKLTNLGQATAVVLPDDLLARLGVGPGDDLEATETSEGGLLLKAGDPDRQRKRAMIKSIMDRYDGALRELAK